MATWQSARDHVRELLWRPGTGGLPDGVADRSIHAALLEIEAERRWFFLEQIRTSEPFTGASLALPLNCGVITSLMILRPDGTTRDLLTMAQIDQVRESAAENVGGWPRYYARHGNAVFLDVPAEANSRFELVYSAATPDTLQPAIDGAADNITLDKSFGAVCHLAAAYVATGFLKDQEEGMRQRAVYDRHLERMCREDDMLREDKYPTQIQPDNFYQVAAHGLWPDY